MIKEILKEVNEANDSLNELQDILKNVFSNGLMKVGRKKYMDYNSSMSTRASNYKSVGYYLDGTTSAYGDEQIEAKMFKFTGDEMDEAKFILAVDKLVSGPYKLTFKRQNSYNAKTGKYDVGIINYELEDKYNNENPDTIWRKWYQDKYGADAIDIGTVGAHEIYFHWYGSTMGGYPRGIRKFQSDFNVDTTDSTSGDGIGDWYGKMTDKKGCVSFPLRRI